MGLVTHNHKHQLLGSSFKMSSFSLQQSSKTLQKESTAARTVSWHILSHAAKREAFRESIEVWKLAQASLSKMDHMEKSITLRSGDDGATCSSTKSEGDGQHTTPESSLRCVTVHRLVGMSMHVHRNGCWLLSEMEKGFCRY